MTTLLVLRERVKRFYARYGGHIIRILRFLTAFSALFLTDLYIGYMTKISHIGIALGAAVICAFLPWSVTVGVCAVFVLVNLYAVSMEVFFVTAAVFFLFLCVYGVFQPGNSILLVLMPVLFMAKMPLVVPVVLGLTGTMFGVIPMSFGIAIYYMLKYVKENAGILASTGSLSMPGRYTQMINGVLGNRTMWVVMAACALTLLVVYLIRRLSVNHAWEIAIVVGTIVNILCLFIGVFVADISVPVVTIIISSFFAAAVGLVLEFFLFHLDYTRTEIVQFEDDDYYYYVKAVPKVAVTQPEVTVTKINAKKNEDQAVEEELFTIRQELGNKAEIMTARKDLEETKELLKEGKKKDLEETQILSDRTEPLEQIPGDDYGRTD